MNSGKVVAGNDGATTITIGPPARLATGAMSRTKFSPPLRSGFIVFAGVIRSSVWPSGGAEATVWAAMALAAPTRFSTITDWPSHPALARLLTDAHQPQSISSRDHLLLLRVQSGGAECLLQPPRHIPFNHNRP